MMSVGIGIGCLFLSIVASVFVGMMSAGTNEVNSNDVDWNKIHNKLRE